MPDDHPSKTQDGPFSSIRDQFTQIANQPDTPPEVVSKHIDSLSAAAARIYKQCADDGVPGFDPTRVPELRHCDQ